MKNRKYTLKELKDFIFSRKDSQKVNMTQSGSSIVEMGNSYCGCILVQFFRKKFKNKVQHVGYSTGTLLKGDSTYIVDATYSDSKKISDFIYKVINLNPNTYKEVKKIATNL